jgi:hypothetical protein
MLKVAIFIGCSLVPPMTDPKIGFPELALKENNIETTIYLGFKTILSRRFPPKAIHDLTHQNQQIIIY